MRGLAYALLVGLAVAASAQPAVPTLTGRVVDRADLLSPETEAVLTNRLAAHEDSTSDQIAVLTVVSLNEENLEQWATEVFRTWGLGREDADNGVLLLIARDDRKIRIEVGYGLEGRLPDATAGAIIRNEMTPRFRDGDFEGGTLAAVDAIIGSIKGEYTVTSEQGDAPLWSILFTLALMGGMPLLILMGNFYASPLKRYVMLLFSAPFFAMSGMISGEAFGLTGLSRSFLGTMAVCILAFIVVDLVLSRQPAVQRKREHHRRKAIAFRQARKAGRTHVVVDGTSYSVPTASSSSGGFSGGGGSSGGGGASGGW